MISMTGSAFDIEGDIIVWVVITDLKGDLEGQRGRSMRYSAEDSSNNLPMGWMESLQLSRRRE